MNRFHFKNNLQYENGLGADGKGTNFPESKMKSQENYTNKHLGLGCEQT